MIRNYVCALLACSLALGTEDFEKLPQGSISSGGTEIAERLYNHPMYEKWNELHGVMFAGE